MLLIWNSYKRCSSIMLISDWAALTLLDSSVPDVTVTLSSVLALPPDLRRSNPSSPFCKSLVGGLTSLMRSIGELAAGANPKGTTDTAPTPPRGAAVEGGMVD